MEDSEIGGAEREGIEACQGNSCNIKTHAHTHTRTRTHTSQLTGNTGKAAQSHHGCDVEVRGRKEQGRGRRGERSVVELLVWLACSELCAFGVCVWFEGWYFEFACGTRYQFLQIATRVTEFS